MSFSSYPLFLEQPKNPPAFNTSLAWDLFKKVSVLPTVQKSSLLGRKSCRSLQMKAKHGFCSSFLLLFSWLDRLCKMGLEYCQEKLLSLQIPKTNSLIYFGCDIIQKSVYVPFIAIEFKEAFARRKKFYMLKWYPKGTLQWNFASYTVLFITQPHHRPSTNYYHFIADPRTFEMKLILTNLFFHQCRKHKMQTSAELLKDRLLYCCQFNRTAWRELPRSSLH